MTRAQQRKALGERRRVERLGRIRQFVFGSMDGLLVPLGVVSGVAGGTRSVKAVVVAGLAEAFAGTLSMGAGEFLSGKAEAQVQKRQIREEHRSIRKNPDYELAELAVILEHEGLPPGDAKAVARKLQASPRSFARTMVEKELGVSPEPKTVRISEGVTIGVSYLLASLVPLAPYFFLPIPAAFPASLALTFLVLIGIGLVRGRLAGISFVRSGLEVLIIGVVTGGGAYFLGSFLPKVLGL